MHEDISVGVSAMPVNVGGEEFLTRAEAAEVAGRSADTIRRWIKRGLVQAHKDLSGRWLIKRESLDRFLRGEKQEG